MTVETEKSKLRIELEQYHDKTIEAYRKKTEMLVQNQIKIQIYPMM